MKTTTKRMILAAALTIAALTKANAFYDPSVGRWASRDPIGEIGGHNVYAFVENVPVSRIDYLGLCGAKCGVTSLRAIDEGWTVTPTWIAFKFRVTAKFKKDRLHSPSCCKLIQWVQDQTTLNGAIRSASGGQPTDGRLHIDGNPYTGDDINDPTNYDRIKAHDTDPADGVVTYVDTPTRGGNPGDISGGDLRFRIIVYDSCNKMKEVSKTGFKMYWKGTWPKIDYGVE